MGTWVQRTAQTWLVYQMTGSAFLVGVLSACQFIPILLLTLVAGTMIDRHSKKKILMTTQAGFLVLGIIMTVLVYTKAVQYWQVLLIAIAYGVLQSFDTPTRQSYVVELVGQKDLMNGISLNSTVFNLAKIAGPSLAGILMVKFISSRRRELSCRLIRAISHSPARSRHRCFTAEAPLGRCQGRTRLCLATSQCAYERGVNDYRVHTQLQ